MSDKLNFTTPTAPSQSIALSTPTVTYNFYHYSTPPNSLSSTYYMNYKANGTFSATSRNTGILGLTATEIDFKIQGFSFVKRQGHELNNVSGTGVTNSNSLGWHYDKPQDCYYWYDSSVNDQYPVGGPYDAKIADPGYRQNNYIGKFVSYGSFNLSFTYQNKQYNLDVIDEGSQTLFITFADATSDITTYGAGRFIDIAKPDANGHTEIDFNKAYNPPCAFTKFATCPLPPPQNRLSIAINAGEKTYGRH